MRSVVFCGTGTGIDDGADCTNIDVWGTVLFVDEKGYSSCGLVGVEGGVP